LLLTNSSLLVDLSMLKNDGHDTIKTIVIKASDTQINNIYAHFNVSLNGILIGSSFVSDSLKEYSMSTNVKKGKNPMLSVCFDNNRYAMEESRNLYIESVCIDGTDYHIDETNSIITLHESLLTTGFRSLAHKTAHYLKALKVDTAIFEIIEFEGAVSNQTLAAAMQFKEQVKTNPPKNLNVSSAGLHGRRTLLTYRRILENDQVGIMNMMVNRIDRNNWYRSAFGIQIMIDELMSYIYTWFYLSFFEPKSTNLINS